MRDLPPKGGWKLRQHSLTKLIVWFTDGNVRTMYSIDWKHGYSERRREIGLDRFYKRIEVYGNRLRTARIYDTVTGTLVASFPLLDNEKVENTINNI